jgi:hypothetical protein
VRCLSMGALALAVDVHPSCKFERNIRVRQT